MAKADKAFIYFNPHTVAHKKLKPITPEQVRAAFGSDNVTVYDDSARLLNDLKQENWSNSNLLMMSSGNFDGLNFEQLPSILGLS
jgi:UDP-N-acetylmuramate: L-alanyl-gamma-D-glutamyl-meso-diaminopimelate ligase